MCTVQEKELLYGKLVELLQRNDSISCLWLDSGQDLFDTVIVQLLNPKLHNFVRELYAAEKITEDVFRNTTEVNFLPNSNAQLNHSIATKKNIKFKFGFT